MIENQPDVTIIQYNAGNVMSVIYALERLEATYEITNDPEKLLKAKRIVFPGVGEAGSAMQSLRQTGIHTLIPTLNQPFLGTCVGMQLLCACSEESSTECLGVFDIEVKKFPKKEGFKVPQTGWNNIFDLKSPILKDLDKNPYVYYNHSFYAPLSPYTVATTDYILPYSAVLQKDNFYACQFHSEISGEVGAQILKSFLTL